MKGVLWAGLLFASIVPGNAQDVLTVMHGQAAVTVHRTDFRLPALPLPDEDKLAALTDRLDRQFSTPPRNAALDAHGRIVPERAGYRLDRRAFSDQFRTYFYGSGPMLIEAPMRAEHARVDSELLAHIKEKPIGHYVTYYNSSNRNRSHNIFLAAGEINNTVIFPGETFSFNRVVGKRTKKRGYVEAPIIVRGELSEGIGGGICQVSSTLFNAADRAGLTIVQRYSHSRSVPYVLPGRDATVSWNGPDFVFRNPYDEPVLLRLSAGGGRMYAAIYSSHSVAHKPRKVPSMSGRLPDETDNPPQNAAPVS